MKPIPRELLEAYAEQAPPEHPAGGAAPSANGTNGAYHHRLDVPKWLAARGVEFRRKPEPDAKGRTVYVLKQCPFNPSHVDPDSCVMQDPGGKLYGFCFHNSCQGRGWRQFKEKIGKPDPDHYDPPLPPPLRVRLKRNSGGANGAGGDNGDGESPETGDAAEEAPEEDDGKVARNPRLRCWLASSWVAGRNFSTAWSTSAT